MNLKISLNKYKFHSFSCSRKYQDHIPCSFTYKIVCIDDKFSKPIVVYKGENAAYEFIKAIHEEYEYCKKVMKNHFNKNLFMTEEEEKNFQSSNTCWICEKVMEDEKVTGKFRDAVHCSCDIILQLTKKVPVIFHNLKGYDRFDFFMNLKN